MAKNPEEWLTQADYDFQTAEFMLSGQRYVYAVFMAHLAIEKILKGFYQKKFQTIPPRTHNLTYFLEKTKLEPPEDLGKFVAKLDQASVATRYPEEFAKLQNIYTEIVVKEMLAKTQEVLEWLKKKF